MKRLGIVISTVAIGAALVQACTGAQPEQGPNNGNGQVGPDVRQQVIVDRVHTSQT